jgi:glyoxylase-like metal-dependent hydrolase (beta-lactamase superfamily II)
MLFQQLFEASSSTYTYIVGDADTREAIIIDPVLETLDRDIKLIEELDLKLLYSVETHIHADHVTSGGRIADKTGAQIVISAEAPIDSNALKIADGGTLKFGRYTLRAIATPGHTRCSMCYFVEDRVFTGDTLLIRGNGRTDFQGGCPEQLYRNVTTKLFSLPDETLVYPGHDYKGFTSSTIGCEKKYNARLGQQKTLLEFIDIMKNLALPPPKKIDIAVPANLRCGRV